MFLDAARNQLAFSFKKPEETHAVIRADSAAAATRVVSIMSAGVFFRGGRTYRVIIDKAVTPAVERISESSELAT